MEEKGSLGSLEVYEGESRIFGSICAPEKYGKRMMDTVKGKGRETSRCEFQQGKKGRKGKSNE